MLRVYEITIDVNLDRKRPSDFALTRIGVGQMVECQKVDTETALDIIKARICQDVEQERE